MERQVRLLLKGGFHRLCSQRNPARPVGRECGAPVAAETHPRITCQRHAPLPLCIYPQPNGLRWNWELKMNEHDDVELVLLLHIRSFNPWGHNEPRKPKPEQMVTRHEFCHRQLKARRFGSPSPKLAAKSKSHASPGYTQRQASLQATPDDLKSCRIGRSWLRASNGAAFLEVWERRVSASYHHN